MSRTVVRFDATLPPTPDELSQPHHTDKARFPGKGILLTEGTFEKKSRDAKATSRRRDKRYSTPTSVPPTMDHYSHRDRHDRSRRRSVSGGLLDSHPRQPYDSTQYHAPQSLPRRRRDSVAPLHTSSTPSQNAAFTLPYSTHATSRRNSRQWQDGDLPYGTASSNRRHSRITPEPANWAAYPGYQPVQPSLGFAPTYGSSSGTRSSTGHYSPEHQMDPRRLSLLPSDGHRSSQAPSNSRRQSQQYSQPAHYPFTPPKAAPSIKDVSLQSCLKRPRIAWNIAVPLSSAAFDSHSKLTLSDLDMTATSPAIDHFSIKFEHSKTQEPLRALYRSIKVAGSFPHEMSDGTTAFLVTIRDVLNAVFEFFQTPISREEYANLTNSEAQMVHKSQKRRVGRHPYAFGEPLRVDLLGEMTKFDGVRISAVKDRKITFALELGRW